MSYSHTRTELYFENVLCFVHNDIALYIAVSFVQDFTMYTTEPTVEPARFCYLMYLHSM